MQGALQQRLYEYLMKTDFSSVHRKTSSVPPSRPWPLDFHPPNGKSRAVDGEQALTATVPASSAFATRTARSMFFVYTAASRVRYEV